MEKLAPAAADAAEAFAKFVAFAGENPGKAITAAIVASIGKAGLDAALAQGLAKAMGTTGGMTVASAAIAITTATLIYKQVQAEKKGAAESVFEDVGKAAKDIDAARAEKRNGAISPEMRDKLERERDALAGDLDLGARGDLTKQRFKALNPFSDTTLGEVGRQEGAQDQGFRADAAARLAEINALLGKSAGDHAKAGGDFVSAAKTFATAVDGFKAVGGFGPAPGSKTGPSPIR